MKRPRPAERPTRFWLDALTKRRERLNDELDLATPIEWRNEQERRAAINFFNAAFRAEESGLIQAHALSGDMHALDPELAEVLELYGNEEGWHRTLLTEFLEHIGGHVEPMGRVTRTLYRLYGRAQRMETIVLANLMFETIGSTTYRLALRHVRQPAIRQMLTILTRDEAFHVPLNVHFLRQVLVHAPAGRRRRAQLVYRLLFFALVALPLASRPQARSFDGISTRELARAYARELALLFAREHDLGFNPPRLLLLALGLDWRALALPGADPLASPTSVESAERAIDRERVVVTALN